MPETNVINVKDFRAAGDGLALDTGAIQSAVNAAAGGGLVYFPNGVYKTTTVLLPSNIVLYISKNAVITASPQQSDWKSCGDPVLKAMSAGSVLITGGGVVDGGGLVFFDGAGKKATGNRPGSIILFYDSRNVTVSGVTLQNSMGWTLKFLQCNGAAALDVTVRNRGGRFGGAEDGIVVQDSRNVLVRGCDVTAGGEGIVVTSLPERDSCNIQVEDCIVTSSVQQKSETI